MLIPFATELNDEYTNESIGAAVLATVLGLAASVNWYMRLYIQRAGLLEDRDGEETSRVENPVAFGLAVLFLLSVPVAFLGPHLAQAMWIATILLRYPLRRLGSAS